MGLSFSAMKTSVQEVTQIQRKCCKKQPCRGAEQKWDGLLMAAEAVVVDVAGKNGAITFFQAQGRCCLLCGGWWFRGNTAMHWLLYVSIGHLGEGDRAVIAHEPERGNDFPWHAVCLYIAAKSETWPLFRHHTEATWLGSSLSRYASLMHVGLSKVWILLWGFCCLSQFYWLAQLSF